MKKKISPVIDPRISEQEEETVLEVFTQEELAPCDHENCSCFPASTEDKEEKQEIPDRVLRTLNLYRGSYNQYVHLSRQYTGFNTELLARLPKVSPHKNIDLPFYIEGQGPVSLPDFVKYVQAESRANKDLEVFADAFIDLVFKNIKNLPSFLK